MGQRMLGPVALVLFLLLPGMVAFAQSPLRTFELERLELNPGAEGSLLVGTGEVLQRGQFRVSALGHYSHRPLLVRQNDTDRELVGVRATVHVAAAYALTNWLQVGAQLPLVALQRGEDLSALGFERPESFGLGTPTVGVRLGLLTQDVRGGLDVAVEGSVGLPVGNPAGFGSDQGWRYMPRVMAGRRFGFIRAAVDAKLMIRPRIPLTANAPNVQGELGNELRIGAALMTTGKRLRWEFNVLGMVPLSKQPGAAELLPGVRYLVNPSLEVFALAGMGVGSAPGTPLFRVLAGGSFGSVTPRRGPGESSVNCELGLAQNKVEECPDGDEDGDSLRNAADRCPLESGPADRQGCPQKDTDIDGIEDALDACPTEQGPAARQGCPVRDQDKDDVEDDVDACPTQAGPAKSRGCPLKDQDGDGLDDDQDDCPKEFGPPERRGCPEEDSDKDGVPNRVDTCAREPGPEANLGCPEHEEPLVAITPRQLELRGKVFFEASQARIQSRSFMLLDRVAQVLREHPEIPRVVVGAHTDDRGFAEENRRLSQQRAEMVKRYLIDKGVSAERLEARGYGQERPLESNATSIGRENNRRVEFKIIRDGDESTEAPGR